jgi:hypothetical protein
MHVGMMFVALTSQIIEIVALCSLLEQWPPQPLIGSQGNVKAKDSK